MTRRCCDIQVQLVDRLVDNEPRTDQFDLGRGDRFRIEDRRHGLQRILVAIRVAVAIVSRVLHLDHRVGAVHRRLHERHRGADQHRQQRHQHNHPPVLRNDGQVVRQPQLVTALDVDIAVFKVGSHSFINPAQQLC